MTRPGKPAEPESTAVADRYARRADTGRYAAQKPDVFMTVQERQRAILRLFAGLGWHDLSHRSLLEVGCGSGGNLLEMLQAGFAPEHLAGIELLSERHAVARGRLPAAVTLHQGDAMQVDVADASRDVVFVSTVFSSLLDDDFQQRLAARMWRWTKPGGGVLWYDFTIDNPRNPDVRGVPLKRVRALFPEAAIEVHRITLAPPLARVVSRWHPALYTLFNAVPMLRTHVLAWLGKR